MPNFQQQQSHKGYKETGKYDLFKEKKIIQQKLSLKKDIMEGLLDKGFKTTFLKMKNQQTLR